MKLTAAIEILKPLTRKFRPRLNAYEREALQISIEAMKAWKEFRGTGSLMDPLLLPGETPEGDS